MASRYIKPTILFAAVQRLHSSLQPIAAASISRRHFSPYLGPNMPIPASYTPLPSYDAVVLSRYPPLPTLLHVELNEPHASNALSRAMFRDWTAAIRWAAQTDDVHVLVVSGRPRKGVAPGKEVFCAGMSMDKTLMEAMKEQIAAGGPMHASIEQARENSSGAKNFIAACIDFPKLLVAAVNGHCFGMGTTMLPLHDFVYTLPNTTFRTPFSELAVCAEGTSSVLFPPILGPGLTSRMLTWAEYIKAEELAPSGFVTQIVSGIDSQALPGWVLNEMATRLGAPEIDHQDSAPLGLEDYTNLSMTSIYASKRLRMNEEYKKFLHEVNSRELEEVAQLVASEAFPAGIQRFFAKQQAKKASAKL